MKIIILLFLQIHFLSAFGQSTPFADLLETYHKSKNFSGAVLVASNGQIRYIDAAGEADRQTGAALTVKSKFKIASMTKVFTAVLVMKLVEEGKISLEQTFGKYFPTYKGEGKNNVTVHQLLTYASGIKNELDPLAMQPYQVKTSLDDFINTYCSGNLVFTPGEKSTYGNTEYIILQKVIENVIGKSYEAYLHDIVLKPLGLKNTNVAKKDQKVNGLVNTYTYNDSLKVFTGDAPYFIENYFAAGSVYSTLEDLLVFSNAIFQQKILKPETIRKMLTINEKLGYTAYGLWGSQGWGTFNEPFYYRTGGILGSRANWIYTADTKTTIIVLSNTDATNLYELSEQLYLLSLDKK
jgi:CubicO group peptidase (beta-lactamase class C family)